VLLATGSMTAAALRVAELLSGKGVSLRVINASTIKPLDNALLAALLSENIPVFTLEEHVRAGGFGSAVLEFAAGVPGNHDITLLAVDDVFVQHGDHAHLLADVGLDDNSIMKTILCHLGKEDTNDA